MNDWHIEAPIEKPEATTGKCDDCRDIFDYNDLCIHYETREYLCEDCLTDRHAAAIDDAIESARYNHE